MKKADLEFYFLHELKLMFCLFVVLPVMLSSKLLPEMEMEDNVKREQLLHGMQSLPVAAQIEKLKVVILLLTVLMI